LIEPTGVAADAATILFNLPDYRVISTTVTAGRRQVIVETDELPGCPSCGVIASRRKERRFQRLRDIPVAGPVDVLWSKYRWYCEEPACDRLSFFESTPQVPRRARSTSRLRDQLVDAVITSGRAVSETALCFAVSWWMVRAAVTEAYLLKLPDVDKLSPRMLGIDEHRFRSVRYFQGPGTKTWTRFEPWMTTIVDLDTGQVLGVVDGRDHKGVGDWLFARPLEWRLAVQVVAIDPSAAFRKALRMWLPRTAVAVDHFHLISLANQAMTETRQNLSQQVNGRRGRAIDKAWAHRMICCCAAATTSAAGPPSGSRKSSPSMIRPAPCRRSGRSRNNSGTCCAPAPWRMPPQPRRSSKNSSRQRRDLRQTGSTARSADGGKRSRCSSSPALRPARSRPTTPPSRTSSEPPAGTAMPPTTNRLFS
jgi:hypothetical protein